MRRGSLKADSMKILIRASIAVGVLGLLLGPLLIGEVKKARMAASRMASG